MKIATTVFLFIIQKIVMARIIATIARFAMTAWIVMDATTQTIRKIA